MINEELYIKSLLLRFIQKQTSADENKKIQLWLEKDEGNANFFLKIKKLWEEENHPEYINKQEVNDEWQKLSKRVTLQNSENKSFVPILKVAAVILILISLSALVATNINFKSQNEKYFTNYGEHKTIILPDKSKVFLNAGSTLSYTRKIFSNSRLVELNGEAYFEVTHNSKEPFIVMTGSLNTTVLGTSFNIKAYPDEYTQTVSLVEGKIEVGNGEREVILSPSQNYLLYKINNSYVVDEFDHDVITGWKDQKLVFKNTPLKEALNSIQRFYGCKIITRNSEILNNKITATFDNTTIDKVWETFEFIIGINCEQSDSVTYIIK